MTLPLYNLARAGEINWLSYYFAEFISVQAQTSIDDLLGLSAALVSEANLAGNVCVDLEAYSGQPPLDPDQIATAIIPQTRDCADWCARLQKYDCVGGPNENSPLVLDGKRLYLNRFWFYEEFVADKVRAMLAGEKIGDRKDVEARVEALFEADSDIDQDQRNGVLIAASKPFSVISGGPGSGKTSTVVRILAVLLKLDPGCRIALAAPTGKAAARMTESIRRRLDQIETGDSAIKSLPGEATTLHRLLGYRRDGFTHGERHPLPFDCVVIDEASMIDLKLMYHLLAALPQSARLILLGDRDQLASVAAGNVLGDITGHGCALDDQSAPVADSIALLRNNYRFDEDSAIGDMATLVNQGRSDAVIELLRANDRGLRWFEGNSDQLDARALAWLHDAYQPIFECDTPQKALEVYESTRLLCATNRGPCGVESLNRNISSALLARNQIPESDLYGGLPVMITRNHRELGLFNGDTGILWHFEQGLRACFRDANGDIRDLAISRLPDFVPAWASTVHKSQGSEFDAVLLILPFDPESGALSRELLYTAVTRARRQFYLHAPAGVVINAVEKLTRRRSGLAQKLGWQD